MKDAISTPSPPGARSSRARRAFHLDPPPSPGARSSRARRAFHLSTQVGSAFAGGVLSGVPCCVLELTMIQQQRFGGSFLGTPLRLVRARGGFDPLALFRGFVPTALREGFFTVSATHSRGGRSRFSLPDEDDSKRLALTSSSSDLAHVPSVVQLSSLGRRCDGVCRGGGRSLGVAPSGRARVARLARLCSSLAGRR